MHVTILNSLILSSKTKPVFSGSLSIIYCRKRKPANVMGTEIQMSQHQPGALSAFAGHHLQCDVNITCWVMPTSITLLVPTSFWIAYSNLPLCWSCNNHVGKFTPGKISSASSQCGALKKDVPTEELSYLGTRWIPNQPHFTLMHKTPTALYSPAYWLGASFRTVHQLCNPLHVTRKHVKLFAEACEDWKHYLPRRYLLEVYRQNCPKAVKLVPNLNEYSFKTMCRELLYDKPQ